MNWTKVKFVAIIVLLAANAFLLVNLFLNSDSNDIISDESVRNLCAVLEDDRIYISESLIDRGEIEGDAYSADFKKTSYSDIVQQITEEESILLEYESSNGYVVVAENNKMIIFSDDFGIEYSVENKSLSIDELVASGGGTRLLETDAEYADAVSIVDSAFNSSLSGADVFEQGKIISRQVESVEYFSDEDIYLVKVYQQIDSVRIYENELFCVVKDGEIVYASGKWNFVYDTKNHPAQNCDILNILFSVKRTVDEMRDSGNSGADWSSVTVIALHRTYCVYLSETQDRVYFVPAYSVEFDNGCVLTYNTIDGTIYTK